MPPKSVLITGCSDGGIGSALALSFQKRGLHVFATARSPAKMSHLAPLPNTTLLPLDVTSPSSLSTCVASVSAQTGGTLDYLINNAGINYLCPTLDVSASKAREVFDVNFWAVLACVQAFAPLLIASQYGGTVVNNSSMLSVLTMPYQSIYCASKAALSCFDCVLRIELAPLGVRVVTLVTGSVSTNINVSGSGFEGQPGSKYEEVESKIREMAYGKDIPNQMSCEEYAEKVVGDILGGAKGRVWRGGNVGLVRWLAGLLPQSVMDLVVVRGSGLDVLGKMKK